jgi:hypothetical protein
MMKQSDRQQISLLLHSANHKQELILGSLARLVRSTGRLEHEIAMARLDLSDVRGHVGVLGDKFGQTRARVARTQRHSSPA